MLLFTKKLVLLHDLWHKVPTFSHNLFCNLKLKTMIKRASTILLTLFLLLLGINTAFAAPSCSTTFSKINFAPTTTGATYYDLDKISFSEGIYTDIKCPLDYVENANPGRGEYTVSGNKLSIGCVKKGNLLSINIPNLKPGKVYSISITGNVRLRAKENDAEEKHRTKFKLAVGKSDNKYFENNKGDWSATGPCNMSLEFKASSDHAAATISTDYSGDCYILDISEIKIIGCFDPTITSSNGNDICKGEETTFTAAGISGGNSIIWKDGTKEIGRGQSITYTPTEDSGIITAGSLSFPYTTKLCCSITAETETAFSQNFNTSIKNPKLQQINPGAYSSNSYSPYSGSGNLGKNEYAIVHGTSEAGQWWKSPETFAYVPENKTLTATDKFLFINCDVVREEMFIYRINKQFCTNTNYEFTARIANVCNEGETPANVKLSVYGYTSFADLNNSSKNGNLIKSYESGNLGANSGWQLARLSFNSGKYEYFRISISNNVADADLIIDKVSKEVVGNDLGIDDIEFKVCKPRVMVYADNALKTNTLEVCDNADQTIPLYAGNEFDNYSSYMKDTWFVLQEAKEGSNLSDDKSWTNVKDKDGNTINAKKFTAVGEFTEVLVKQDQGETYYRAIVASDEQIANDVASGKTPTGCSVYGKTIKKEDYTLLTISCKDKSIAPTLKDYKECPSTDGKLDLYTRITAITLVDGTKNGTKIDLSNKTVAEKKTEIAKHGEIKWYKGNATTPLTDAETIVDLPSSADVADIYNATFTQKPSAITTYEASSKASVKVEIKKTIEVTVSPEEIEGCLSEISKDPAGRTFYVTKVNPVASPATDYTYTWKNVKTDGTEDATPLKSGDENFYALPSEAGSGTIKLYVESKTTAACPSVAKELTYNIADNPNFECAINVPCNTALATTGVAIELTKISGSTNLTIKRDGTTIKTENLTTGTTTYSYADKTVPASATSVEYEIILGAGSCSKTEKKSYTISSENIFELTSDAKDVDDSKNIEYHICKGEDLNYHVISSYKLEPGKEYFKWYRDGELIDDDDLKYSNSYKITEMLTDKTVFKVEIVAEEGEESCGGKATVTIYGDDAPSIEMTDINLCYGESTTLQAYGGDSYTWSPSTYLSNVNIANPTVTQPQDDITYTVKVEKGVCSEEFSVKVNVNTLPVINTIDVKTLENGERDITVNVSEGESPYTYSLDDKDYDVLEEILKRVSIGWNKLYVLDANKCGSSKMFEIEPIEIIPDKYFSPNGDGVNDLWEIKNLEVYSSYIVEIFTRHGKRIFIQRVGSFNIDGVDDGLGSYFSGWKGEYNGKPMPSDDYWYLITVEDIRKQYTGHFTLKR